MTARILDGKAAAAQIKSELTETVSQLRRAGAAMGLATVLVGDDAPSHSYVNLKHRDCAEIGLPSLRVELPATASAGQVLAAVEDLNHNPDCSAYIVQLPLPRGLDDRPVLAAMDPAKDADGLHPANLGMLALTVHNPITTPVPCTPRGCLELLRRNGIDLNGMNVCVIGRGTTVGRSLGLLLTHKQVNATVTLCHTGTRDLAAHTRQADLIISAAGVPGIVTAGMVAPGAVVLDVGVARVADEAGTKRLRGDVAPDVYEVAGWVSPNPGGAA
ncbi:MAG: bifunctional methylenetetrahydrofolate dehydrogenase/methenyltetrahydrofolate cyclohydrolase [Micrococcales bacterium]|nr:MAG: bifunctional methylenetetrahydrofolate dehydrogenase/methenyltetrahydrofolate cyclohydrolase [Micrococcales bacterium]